MHAIRQEAVTLLQVRETSTPPTTPSLADRASWLWCLWCLGMRQATPTALQLLVCQGFRGSDGLRLLSGGEPFSPALLPLTRTCRQDDHAIEPAPSPHLKTCAGSSA